MRLSEQVTFLILYLKHLHFKVAMFLRVEMIPDEFETWADYTKAFHNPTLVEIWHQINLALILSPEAYMWIDQDKQDSGWPNVYNFKLKVLDPQGRIWQE